MMQKQIKIFGQTLTLSLRHEGDVAVSNEIFQNREYRLCDEIIQPAKNGILDIGGHVGFFALYASLLNSKVPIYSFEPHEGNYALLKENLKQNRVKNVIPKNLAVANQEGDMELLISDDDMNHSLIYAIEETGQRQKVRTITLEKILNRHQLTKIDLLKLDCEGAEFQILEQAPAIIFDKVSNIFLEYHDWTPEADHHRLKRFLEKQGYQVKDYPNHRMKQLGFLWAKK